MNEAMRAARDQVAWQLHRERGLPISEALRISNRAIARLSADGSGLGQEPTPSAPTGGSLLTTMKAAGESEAVRATREAVSPWLWVMSVLSFLRNFFGKK